MKLTKEQVNEVIKWMETWEQLKDTAIPMRFKEDFTENDAKQPVMRRLKAVQTLRNNPDLLLLMAEFKRANFVGSYIMQYQIEDEEELAAVWLSQMEAQLFRSNGA